MKMASILGQPQSLRPLPRAMNTISNRRIGGPHLKVSIPANKRSERDRNDSGCFDDETSSTSSSSTPDALSHSPGNWEEIIGDWAIKSHSIISQEMIRMQEMTRAKRKELADIPEDPAAQSRIAERWKVEMADMMEITQDLIQCLANDIVETNSSMSSSCGSSTTSMTSQDLGRILEEELFQDDDCNKEDPQKRKNNNVFLVRTQKKSRKNRRKHRSRNSKDRRDSAEIEIDGKVWRSQNTFMIQVDEIKNRVTPITSDDEGNPMTAMSGSWQWRKDLDSPVAWDDLTGDEQEEANEELPEVEDIYADWLDMLRKKKVRRTRADINDVFWNISLDPRQRRMSEVLDNLPFSDHPDVFFDQCELLEGSRRMVKGRKNKKRAERPKMSYWNIFSQWKRNLKETLVNEKEERPKKPKKKVRKSPQGGKRRRPLNGAKKQRSVWFKRPRHNSIHVIEDYFSDFIDQFDEMADASAKKRGSVDMDSEPNPLLGRSSKRQKTLRNNYRENWEFVKLESDKSFDLLTRNIEQKIREAFKKTEQDQEVHIYSPSSSEREDGKHLVEEEDFERFPKAVARKMRKSRRRFNKLRCKVRKVREAKKRLRESLDLDLVFQESSWIFEEPETLEDIFLDGIGIFETETETMSREEEEETYEVVKSQKKFHSTFSTSIEDSNAQNRMNRSSLLRQKSRHKANKFANRLRMKCQAKQPMQRGRV